jgi:hypothetical protein
LLPGPGTKVSIDAEGSRVTRKRLMVVGNGPLSRDFSAEVESADFVIRFNEPKQGKGLSGTRTDRLYMANSGKPMQRRLNDPDLIRSPIFLSAREIVLAYHPQIIARYFRKPNVLAWLGGRRADWTAASIAKFGGAGKEIRIMPPQFYLAGCRELSIPEERMNEVFPSTGFFGIWHELRTRPAEEWVVELCGFTWAGWRRHTWGDERKWISDRVAEGRIVLIDPDVEKVGGK